MSRAPSVHEDKLARSRAGGELGRQRLTAERLEGLRYAARWKAGRREEALTRAAIAANGLAPSPAVGPFPYPHRTFAEWSSEPTRKAWNDALAKEGR